MNICVISGRLVREALVVGEGKTFRFLAATRYRYRDGEIKEGSAVVPCVLFEPGKELEALLTDKGKGTVYFDGTGRVQQRVFDGEGGEKKYVTEVVLDPATVSMRRQ